MENKKIRRYLAWLLIGVSIIVIGVLGNALIEKGEPTVDQNLIQKQGSDGNIKKIDGENPESTRNLVYARSSHTATTTISRFFVKNSRWKNISCWWPRIR